MLNQRLTRNLFTGQTEPLTAPLSFDFTEDLGDKRKLSLFSQNGGAAAAYSLRALGSYNEKVVRVRRGSDNEERDFSSVDALSGGLTSFVNAQVVAPLDIQELTATGRDGDFLIAKAAYSLRSLGTRQATVAATGDTVARADGQYVAQVRRSSDDALKSFTATEVTDGTLLAFTNADYAKYTSDFSAGTNSWGDSLDDLTAAGNIDGIGGLDNNLRLTIGSATSQHRAFRSNIFPVSQKINFSIRVFIPSTNSVVDSFRISDASGTHIVASTTPAQDQWVTVTASNVTPTNNSGQLRLFLQDGGVDNFAGNGSDVIYVREVVVTQVTSDGLVRTWYDQSVTNQSGDTATGNHAVQATAASQPKIVNAGALVKDGEIAGLDFDGDDFLVAPSASLLTSPFSLFSASVRDTTGYTVSISKSTAANRYFGVQEATSTSIAAPRNSTSGVSVSASASGSDRLTFAVTTGETSTSVGAKGGTLVNTTGDYGNDFRATDGMNQIAIGVLRTVNPSGYFNGRIREIIFYNSDQSANRTAIEANIGEAYSIDLPSGVDAGFDQVDGFVETWYDQSGNGRHSTNTTATQQPLIVEAGVFQNGLKFTHTDTTNGKRLFVPRTQAELGGAFAFVWVGKVTESDTSFNNLLGGLRGVQSYATGTTGIAIKSSDGTVSFINESATNARTSSNSSTATTLNEDFVAFATYEEAESGPETVLSINGNRQFFSFGSSYNLSSTKDIGIMNATGSSGGYRTQESPTGICREVLVYDTHQGDHRLTIENNINNQYDLF